MGKITNLYEEIIDFLKHYGKTIKDIKWIGTKPTFDVIEQFKFDINEFLEVAKNKDYDSGFGSVKIPLNLLIVGEDWWLERDEYDGQEGWSFKSLPKEPKIIQKINTIPEDFDQEYQANWEI